MPPGVLSVCAGRQKLATVDCVPVAVHCGFVVGLASVVFDYSRSLLSFWNVMILVYKALKKWITIATQRSRFTTTVKPLGIKIKSQSKS